MPSIDALFDKLLERGASDLHLSVDYPPMTRVRGDLVPLGEGLLDPADVEDLLFPILLPEQKDKYLDELDLDFAYAYGTRARFRANYFYKVSGMAAVFRTIPTRSRASRTLARPRR